VWRFLYVDWIAASFWPMSLIYQSTSHRRHAGSRVLTSFPVLVVAGGPNPATHLLMKAEVKTVHCESEAKPPPRRTTREI
jgi:hypothetical protein